jgi:ABC-type sugar transport system substrate-binding protein
VPELPQAVATHPGCRRRRPGGVEEAGHLRGAQLEHGGQPPDVARARESLAAFPTEHRGRVDAQLPGQGDGAEGEGLAPVAQIGGHGGCSVSSGLISGERSHSRAADVSICSEKHREKPLTHRMLALTLGPVTLVTRGETAPLTKEKPVVNKTLIAACAITMSTLTLSACGGSSSGSSDDGKITMGFAQVGAESGWRTANTKSIQETAKSEGVDLKFSDAQQKQENQIKAIRSYIQQKVDVIAFSPVVETGWDAVLQEAKRANIPVILTDRSVDSEDESLYETFLGSDFVLEGEKAGEWLVDNAADADVDGNGKINVVELQGTTGAAPAIDRKQGFEDATSGESSIEVVASQTGDFTRDGGKKVMETFLNSEDGIDVVYAHNDDMGLGAIEAIEAAGLTPGKDIKIITVDAVKDGMTALADGKISFIVECNPLLGPQLMDLAQKVVDGEDVPKRVVTEETTFTQDQAKDVLADRQY